MNNKNKNKVNRIAGLALLAMLGAAAGYWGAQSGIQAAAELPGEVVAAVALLLIPVCFFVIGVHEAGHALAGVAVKFDFRTFVVGPLLWDKEKTGWKFKWNKNVNTFGGLVICIPTPSENLNTRFALYTAGGPLASVVLAVLAYGLYQLLDGFVPVNFGLMVMSSLLYIISIVSALIFIITIIPVHSGGFSSDGARLMRLMRGGDTARFEIMLLQIISTSMAGTRPSQYALKDIQEAKVLASKIDAPMGIYLDYYLYYHALDSKQNDLAEQHLKSYLEQITSIPEGLRGSAWLDAALFYAWVKQDSARALTYYQHYKPSAMIPNALVLATEAALANLQSDLEKARLLAQQALTEVPNMIDRGVAITLHEMMLLLSQTSSHQKLNVVEVT